MKVMLPIFKQSAQPHSYRSGLITNPKEDKRVEELEAVIHSPELLATNDISQHVLGLSKNVKPFKQHRQKSILTETAPRSKLSETRNDEIL
jgi:hypothetical protein